MGIFDSKNIKEIEVFDKSGRSLGNLKIEL